MRSSLLDSLDSCPAQDYQVTSLALSILTRHTTMDTSSPLLFTHVRQLEGNELGVSPLCDKGCRGDRYFRHDLFHKETEFEYPVDVELSNAKPILDFGGI